jgi:hypothetical protein
MLLPSSSLASRSMLVDFDVDADMTRLRNRMDMNFMLTAEEWMALVMRCDVGSGIENGNVNR